MKEKRGFTLIELLAVIVILAIIALIAVPIILNIVEKAKKSAFQDSAYGLIESAKLLYTESILDGDSKDQVFEFGEGKTNNLKYSGSAPKGGTIVLTKEGEIEVAIHNNEWCATKGKTESKVTLTKYESGKCEVTNKPDVPVEPEVTNADTSGAEKPNLNGLVPIKWNGTTWIKADEKNGAGANQWYDYNSQMWANAASVTEEYRNKNVGEEIPESAINAYFVWVPRYEYQYTNLSIAHSATPDQININFITIGKTSPSSNYKIHPAFTFGSTQLAGFWVGKFETTGDGTTPTIKPNVNSLGSQNVSTQFATAQKFSASGNSYGISTSADAHMMKNSEWGAVAYLSQSRYGKYGNSSYSGANKEVYINNYWNGKTMTGCGAGVPTDESATSCPYTYEKSPGGTGASTSGTIYGVYDMNGGAQEYVMGVYNSTVGSSGFSSLPASKYYDNYTSTTATTACSGGICYGHALSETMGWYSDNYSFLRSDGQWITRSGLFGNGNGAGLFYLSTSDEAGSAHGFISFRVTMIG